jgi:hypothetical protein
LVNEHEEIKNEHAAHIVVTGVIVALMLSLLHFVLLAIHVRIPIEKSLEWRVNETPASELQDGAGARKD